MIFFFFFSPVAHGIYNIVLFSTLIGIMEALGKKRKGLEILRLSHNSPKPLTTIWPHLSLENNSRHKKKCNEDEVREVRSSKSVFQGIGTAPPCGSICPNPPGKGLKRKIGCIDAQLKWAGRRRSNRIMIWV